MHADGIRDLFDSTGPVQIRRMFGAHGIYREGHIIALEDEGMIWLKTDAISRPEFSAAGSRPFTYAKQTGDVTITSYWLLPEAALDDPDVMRHWVGVAEQAARRVALTGSARKPAQKAGRTGAAARSGSKMPVPPGKP